MGNTIPEVPQDREADNRELANPVEEQPTTRLAAWVRVLCKDGDVHTAIYGHGADCAAAYANAEAKAAAHCHIHGGVQKLTRVKCPFP